MKLINARVSRELGPKWKYDDYLKSTESGYLKRKFDAIRRRK